MENEKLEFLLLKVAQNIIEKEQAKIQEERDRWDILAGLLELAYSNGTELDLLRRQVNNSCRVEELKEEKNDSEKTD